MSKQRIRSTKKRRRRYPSKQTFFGMTVRDLKKALAFKFIKPDMRLYVDIGGPMISVSHLADYPSGVQGAPTLLFRLNENELPRPRCMTDFELIQHIDDLCDQMIRRKKDEDDARRARQTLEKMFPMVGPYAIANKTSQSVQPKKKRAHK